MTSFIELYDINRRPITVSVDEISSVQSRPGIYTNAFVTMNNGTRFEVIEEHREIIRMITAANRPVPVADKAIELAEASQ